MLLPAFTFPLFLFGLRSERYPDRFSDVEGKVITGLPNPPRRVDPLVVGCGYTWP